VLVVEAGLNSGTLITARQAAEQGKEVFALPGSLHNPMAKGCHRLIREGARLVETVNDVMSELAPMAGALASELRSRSGTPHEAPAPEPPSGEAPDDPEYAALLAAMEHDPRTVEELSQLTGMPVRSVSSMLLMLELQGRVQQHSSGRYLKVR
jgi:DNA processing protein